MSGTVETLVSRIREVISSIHIRRCTILKRSFTKVNLFIPKYDLDLKYYHGLAGCEVCRGGRGLLRGRYTGLFVHATSVWLPQVMTQRAPIVFVLDHDTSLRSGLNTLFSSVGLNFEFIRSPLQFLQKVRTDVPSCLVLDVRLREKSGLDLQRELAEKNILTPLIFLTAHGDIPMAVRAMKSGAVEFLTKPYRDQDLLDAIQIALDRDRNRQQRQAEIGMLRARLESLTPREREVLPLVVSGFPNKQIADQIGTTESTIKVHRSQLMKKFGAESLPELVRMADKIGIPLSKRKSSR